MGMGLIASLSLSLVAFEWRFATEAHGWSPAELPLEDMEAVQPPMPWRRAQESPAERKQLRKASHAAIIADAIQSEPDRAKDPIDVASTGATGSSVDTISADTGNPPEAIEYAMLPWRKGDERMPCWSGCEQLRGNGRDACTEERIQRYLDRNFRVPANGPSSEFTVVTLAIEADGRASTLACRPRPSAATEREVQRVVDAMPAFVPGEQNGKPVRVVYQLPLHVKRR